ncbi:Aminomethyltransferase, mitochondrial [Phlyctochytrium bullatum]|nr:Aminomethyltransferase, mitochondrial [Phlyctochytrium bullatum]
MTARPLQIKGIEAYVSRCGYTGEDGFEISLGHEESKNLCEILMQSAEVKLAGLGARDSLRLEAGLCLYGHDIDDSTTPVEASLAWTIAKRRRAEGGFLGSETILPLLQKGANVPRRRVGFIVEGAPARGMLKRQMFLTNLEGAIIKSPSGEDIGVVTSGCPSPVLKTNVAMGYVQSGFHKQGTELGVVVRNRVQKATVTKMPFVEHR